jgi:hypothetical protein
MRRHQNFGIALYLKGNAMLALFPMWKVEKSALEIAKICALGKLSTEGFALLP